MLIDNPAITFTAYILRSCASLTVFGDSAELGDGVGQVHFSGPTQPWLRASWGLPCSSGQFDPLAVCCFASSWRLTRLSALVLRLGAVIWLLV